MAEFEGNSGGGNDSGSGVAVDSGSSGGDGGSNSDSQLQDRMGSGLESGTEGATQTPAENPFYSESNGVVCDGVTGKPYVNPTTNQPFTSMDEFNEYVKTQPQQNNGNADNLQQQVAAVQSNTPQAFSDYFGKNLDAQKLVDIGKAGESYKYNMELLPTVEAAQPGAQPAAANAPVLSPIENVEQQYTVLREQLTSPYTKMYQALIGSGVTQQVAMEFLNKSGYNDVNQLLNTNYQRDRTKAMKDEIAQQTGSITSQAKQKELEANANTNIKQLAQKYYPQGGENQLFSLLAGYTDSQGLFHRGEAAHLIDLLANVHSAAKGTKYTSHDERNTDIKGLFQSLMANPASASAVVDLAHNYWVGKNASKAFSLGKQAAAKEAQQAKRVIRTPVQSFGNPSQQNEGSGNSVIDSLLASGRP